MATVSESIQPSGYIKTTNKDGVEIVTDFKLVSVRFVANPPIYKMEEVCLNCGGDEFSYLVQGKTCVQCNEKMVYKIELNLEKDDMIDSRFEILDL